MKTVAFALFAVFVAFVVRAQAHGQAPAQSLEGWRYDHLAITHSGPAEADALVSKALADWGAASGITDGGPGLDIVIEVRPRLQSNTSAQTIPWGRPETGLIASPGPGRAACTIQIIPAVLGQPLAEWVVAHEVGHCLGFDHGWPADCIMINVGAGALCREEAEAAASLYPRPAARYRTFIPQIVR